MTTAGWRPTAAVLRVTVLPAAIGLVAVLGHRPDLLAVAAPLALALLSLLRRPSGTPEVRLELGEETVAEGAPVPARLVLTGAEGAETLAAAVATPDWVRPDDGRRVAAAIPVEPDGTAVLDLHLRARRWGRSEVGPAVVTLSAAGGLLRWGPVPAPSRRLAVLPLTERYRGAERMPRARGNVGVHASRRLGDGMELTGIRPFAAGDRIRRINWRISLRTGELHVNATTTERDADVVLLLDARYDAGRSGGIDGSASGVDVAVRATAALAAFYLGTGDRVGLVTYAAGTRQLPASAGRAQLHRLLQALLDVAGSRPSGPEPPLPEPIGVDARALVLVVSPLVGRLVFDRAAALARAGHSVIAVDTLPDRLDTEEPDAWSASVLRLWRLERATRVTQLRDLGVPVVRWHGSGSLDGVLVDLARAAQSGRPR
ncbi:MAG: DUF58 domain-containing protein [Gaiellaceae bacterium]